MSTLVMVEKDGVACMAAETLTSYGSRKQQARYVTRPEKIIRVNDSYVGSVGWAVNLNVLESVFSSGLELPEVRSELELFEFSRVLHRRLKDEYFLNPRDGDGDAFESTQMTVFVMNRHGLFGLYSNRSVERYQRFSAVGSGAHFALGAMYAAYELDAPAEDIARMGVEAGIEFDDGSLGPITLKRVKLSLV
jgi:ATP-dependent protease HslVU (ClpYQ) peptidase subunit